MKDSITADEKKLLEYVYEIANNILDYCHRNNMILPVSIEVQPNYEGIGKVYDYTRVRFAEFYPSERARRVVTMGHNPYTDDVFFKESLYEDKDYE